jgi:hypothetical protein
MRVGSTDDWAVLSNRLLLLQEVMVGLSQLPLREVAQRAAEGVTWVFDGGTLHTLKPAELSPRPLITRGRTRLAAVGEVYLAYFAGPPEPLYVALSGVFLTDPQEFRLAALYFEHLLAALSAAGYREELARQARTDWLTGLPNRRSLARLLASSPAADVTVGLLEARSRDARTQADHDMFQKGLAEALLQVLPEGGQVFQAGAFRNALFVSQRQAEGTEQGARRSRIRGNVRLGGASRTPGGHGRGTFGGGRGAARGGAEGRGTERTGVGREFGGDGACRARADAAGGTGPRSRLAAGLGGRIRPPAARHPARVRAGGARHHPPPPTRPHAGGHRQPVPPLTCATCCRRSRRVSSSARQTTRRSPRR